MPSSPDSRSPDSRSPDSRSLDSRAQDPRATPPSAPPVAGASADMVLKRPAAFFLVLLLLVLGAVALERGLRPWRAYYSEPGVGAQWIWAEDAADSGIPTSFWLVRDVDWPSGSALAGRLAIAADEGYEFWLNGLRIGSRLTTAGRGQIESDLYDVTRFLEAGVNRLVVEVHSSRGAGGLLASLRDSEGRPVVVTDESWSVVRRFDRALFQGRTPLASDPSPGENGSRDQGKGTQTEVSEEPERPIVWGHPPTGRWRVRPAQSPRKLPELRPAAAPPARPVRMRYTSSGSEWTEIDHKRRTPSVQGQILVDFGREVTGFLALDLHRTPDAARDGAAILLFLSRDRLPRPGLEDLRPDVVAVPLPGAPGWRALHPQRFRYAAVIGAPPGARLHAEPVSTAEAAAWVPPLGGREGVFGLKPATGYTPVEEMVWDRLGGVRRAKESADTSE